MQGKSLNAVPAAPVRGHRQSAMLAAVSLKARRANPPEFDLIMAVNPEASDHYLCRGFLRSPLRGYLRQQMQARSQQAERFRRPDLGRNYIRIQSKKLSQSALH